MGSFFALTLCEGLVWLAPQKLLPARLRDLSKRMELYRGTDSIYDADKELLFKIRPHTDTVVDHPDYHVRIKTNLNLGIPSQGPPQYTRILKRYALPLRPRVVFYGFYFNDLNSSNRFNRLQRNWLPVSRYMRQYSILYNLIHESRPQAATEEAEPAAGDGAQLNIVAEDVRRSLARQNRNFEQRWQLTAKEIDDAIQAVHASRDTQVEMVMLYLPSRWEVYWEQLKAQNKLADDLDIDRLRRTVVEYCGQRKLPCFDLTAVLKREAQRGKQLYFPIDGHWNKEGNRIVAAALQKFLMEKGLAG